MRLNIPNAETLLPTVHPLLFEKGHQDPVSASVTARNLFKELQQTNPIETCLQPGANATKVVGYQGKVYKYTVTEDSNFTCVTFIEVTPYVDIIKAWERDFNVVRKARDNLQEALLMRPLFEESI